MTITPCDVGPYSVRLWEDGAGDPVLYLHGFEQHPGGAAFLQRLARTRRVLAPELPGYGQSSGFGAVTDVVDLALFLRELVTARGIDRVDVIGHSLGGMFAGELAALSPHLVRRLVLVDAYGLWLDDHPSVDVFGLTDRELRSAKWHDPDTAPDPEPTIFEPDPADPLATMLARSANLAVAGKFLWPLPDRGLRRRLPYVKAPTLVVHGESDGLVPLAYAEEAVRLVPGARLATIRAAGHLPMIEREDDFFAVVDPFLAVDTA